MASLPHRTLGGDVFHPLLVPVLRAATLSAHQIDVSISFQLDILSHFCLSDFTQHRRFLFTPQVLRFNVDIFKHQNQASQLLGSMLTGLIHFPPGSTVFHSVIDEIWQRGLQKIADSITSNMEQPVVLNLSVLLAGMVVQHINYDNEWDLMLGRTLEESELELETSNYGMVPAEESSIEKILKKMNRVEGDGDCMICLEELEDVSSYASQMPCSHAFHSNCIETWLKQSHYCPVCRFEMPTSRIY